jgi:hypothetical protein
MCLEAYFPLPLFWGLYCCYSRFAQEFGVFYSLILIRFSESQMENVRILAKNRCQQAPKCHFARTLFYRGRKIGRKHTIMTKKEILILNAA